MVDTVSNDAVVDVGLVPPLRSPVSDIRMVDAMVGQNASAAVPLSSHGGLKGAPALSEAPFTAVEA